MKESASQHKAIRNQQANTGPVGLNIPELPEDASDDEILAALANLDAAKTKLFAKRRALAEDAEELLSSRPKISEDQAVLRSNQIKGILRESKKGITALTGLHSLVE